MNTLFLHDDGKTTKKIAKIMASVISMSKYMLYTDTAQISKYSRIILVLGSDDSAYSRLSAMSDALKGKWVGLIVSALQNTHMEAQIQQAEVLLKRKLDFTAFVSQEQYVDDSIEAAEKLYKATAGEETKDPAVLEAMEQFLRTHNTGVLSTGWGRHVRATPIEYIYEQGHLYLFSEGGGKFAHLYRNDHVSFCVFEPFTDFQHLAGLQLYGKARIVEPDESEYEDIASLRKIPAARLRAMPVMLHVIDITLTNAVYLWAGFTKMNKPPRQSYEF